jgi:hypothetical protein
VKPEAVGPLLARNASRLDELEIGTDLSDCTEERTLAGHGNMVAAQSIQRIVDLIIGNRQRGH